MKFNSVFNNIELHSHLDGSCQAETLYKISKQRSINIPFKNANELKEYLEISKNSDLKEFLKKFEIILPIVAGDKEAIGEICDDYVRICADAHICYAEPRFSPHLLIGDYCDVDNVVTTVLDVLERSGKRYGVEFRVLLSAMRQIEPPKVTVLDLALKYNMHGVVGIDLAGDEQYSLIRGTNSEIIKMFQLAKKEGIHRTVHAGENGSVAMVEEAIDKMYAERIGHGYQVLEDEVIYQRLRNKDVHFEICPSSSFLTGAVSDKKDQHPIHRFVKDQLNYSINCDDLMITGRNLQEEYDFCKSDLNISEKEIRRCNFNAANSCFLEEEERVLLLNHLRA